MAIYSQAIRKTIEKIKPHFPHFAVELFLITVLAFVVGANVSISTDSGNSSKNQSLFFAYLKEHPEMNSRLVETSEGINVRLTGSHDLVKQVLAASSVSKEEAQQTKDSSSPLPTLSGLALLKPNPSTSDGLLPKRDVEVYTVRGGDTVSTIAATFGVSADTILWENNLSSATLIKPGQQLRILPTSGVKHVVKSGENLYSIAQRYGVDLELILEYNEIEIPEHIFAGEEIIIPNGSQSAPVSPERQSYLASLQREDYETAQVDPNFSGSSSGLVWPMPAASRLSQSYWSRHRAIDVPCKSCEVNAAADGVVELAGYQRGYGNTIVINHGGGLKTRYAHASSLKVSAGQQVSQGELIMISGNTGRSTGPHLHFEVIKNGVLLNPLSVVSR